MKTLTNYLEECKKCKGFQTDSELAEYLGITRASLSVMKKGGGASQETAERIAEGAKVTIEDVWMASLIQKEQNPKFKAILENVTKRAGRAATIAVVAVMASGFSIGIEEKGINQNIHYAKFMRWLKRKANFIKPGYVAA